MPAYARQLHDRAPGRAAAQPRHRLERRDGDLEPRHLHRRYVFPGDAGGRVGQLEAGGALEVLDVEALRPHYALTLRAWRARLEAHGPT